MHNGNMNCATTSSIFFSKKHPHSRLNSPFKVESRVIWLESDRRRRKRKNRDDSVRLRPRGCAVFFIRIGLI